ncbi:MAG: hypothetical protein KUG82_08890 [Pseudomonadales bacterium]|nr:hypothetical protein [Pseudomonadales bacterium]
MSERKKSVCVGMMSAIMGVLLIGTFITYSYALVSLDVHASTRFVKSWGQPYVVYFVFLLMIPWGLMRYFQASSIWGRSGYFMVFIGGLLLSVSVIIAYAKIL